MNIISAEELERLHSALNAGLSIRQSAKVVGLHRETARRYFHMLPPALCRCGLEQTHKGGCLYRASLKRVGTVGAETLLIWNDLKPEVRIALKRTKLIKQIAVDRVAELRRFYQPHRRAFEGSFENGTGSVVAIQEADQDQSSFALFAALEKLHPAVKKFVLAITEGASVEDAAQECGLSESALSRVMPSLKVFLQPYLTA